MVIDKSFILCGLFVLALTGLSASSALGDLAATLSAGEWAELSTNNINPTLSANGASGMTFGYTEDCKYDPNSGKLFFVGGDHADQPNFICYDEATNTWSRLPKQGWMAGTMHGYDHHAMDEENGILYYRPFQNWGFHKYDISSETWTSLPSPQSHMEYQNCCIGLEYFPELKSVMYVSLESGIMGSLIRYFPATNQWYRVGPGKNLRLGGLHHFAEYNPVHKVVIFGGGNNISSTPEDDSRFIYKVDTTGQITQLNDAPVGLGIQQSINTVDPASGDYLVFTSDKEFYIYDVTNDTWHLQNGTPPIFNSPVYNPPCHGIVATSISKYGVVIFIKAYQLKYNSDNAWVYLYKHDPSGTKLNQKQVVSLSPNIHVKPNPFHNLTRITLPALARDAELTVYNLAGKQVQSNLYSDAHGLVWQAKGLPSGIYLLRAKIGKQYLSKCVILLE